MPQNPHLRLAVRVSLAADKLALANLMVSRGECSRTTRDKVEARYLALYRALTRAEPKRLAQAV